MGREKVVVYTVKSSSLLCCFVYRFVARNANETGDPDENDLYGCVRMNQDEL